MQCQAKGEEEAKSLPEAVIHPSTAPSKGQLVVQSSSDVAVEEQPIIRLSIVETSRDLPLMALERPSAAAM